MGNKCTIFLKEGVQTISEGQARACRQIISFTTNQLFRSFFAYFLFKESTAELFSKSDRTLPFFKGRYLYGL